MLKYARDEIGSSIEEASKNIMSEEKLNKVERYCEEFLYKFSSKRR
jgi:hypothetical protein